jgi:SPOR domain
MLHRHRIAQPEPSKEESLNPGNRVEIKNTAEKRTRRALVNANMLKCVSASYIRQTPLIQQLKGYVFMPNKQQAGALELSADNKLIHLDSGTRDTGQARDINAKINLLESSLGELQTALDQINRSVDEGLERLGDTDLDLTAKVSETYKRLGEIDTTYRSLSTISGNIDTEVKKLTVEIADLVEKSAAELEQVDSRSSQRHAEISTQHEQLVTRVNELVGHSKQTQEQLEQSIKTNTDALLGLEKQLVAEIQSLADSTQQRDNALETDLDAARKAIQINRARILQLQAVDEALDKRAAALEITADELTHKTGDLRASVDILNVRNDELSRLIEKLREQADNHATLISGIQKNIAQIAYNLVDLAGIQKKHFRVLSGLIALIVLAIAGFYYYQLDTNQSSALQLTGLAQQDVTASTEITQVQNDLKSLNNSVNGELAVLNERLSDEVSTLQGQLQNMDDQAQSLDGRLDYMSPFSSFGKNSVIHGPQWLAAQSADTFVIRVASVSDRSSLYEIAQRYSHYFKDDMAYYPVDTERGERYVLVSGNFASKREADSALRQMPRYVEFQRPVVTRLGDLRQ